MYKHHSLCFSDMISTEVCSCWQKNQTTLYILQGPPDILKHFLFNNISRSTLVRTASILPLCRKWNFSSCFFFSQWLIFVCRFSVNIQSSPSVSLYRSTSVWNNFIVPYSYLRRRIWGGSAVLFPLVSSEGTCGNSTRFH